VADNALIRAKKALQQLPSPNSRAVVPVDRSSSKDLIALARAAAGRSTPDQPAPVKTVPIENKSTALIAQAKEAAKHREPDRPAPVKTMPVEDKGSTALVARLKEGAARPVPVVQKAPAPPNEPAPVKAEVEALAPAPVQVPIKAPASVPSTQVVPVQISPGQTVPVEVPQNAVAGAQQPINVTVNVVNEQRGYWGPYWYPYPYWHGCGRRNCPHLRGLSCNGWFC
jgi:hypothetical protein